MNYKLFETIKNKFYQTEVYFNNFENITEEDLEMLQEYALLIQELTKSELTKSDKYFRALTIINEKKERRDFDKNVLALIFAMDPALVLWTYYVDSNIVSNKAIFAAKTEVESRALEEKQKRQIAQYRTDVRNEIGFFDAKLMKYEKAYYNKFIKTNNKTK